VAVGARVFALAPHADAHVFREGEVRLMDGAIPPERAVLAASLETAINCVWDSGASLGDSAVVIGGGVIGLLIARLACSAGATVRLVEPSPRRRSAGRALGVSCVAPGEDDPRADADVVFEATGHPSVLDRAIAHAGFEATVVVASFYGARTAPVSLGGDFHRRRLILRSSQVSAIPPARAPRWSAARRFGLVQQLLRDPAWDAVLDPPVPFDAAPATYASLERAPGDALQTVFVYR
jgi:threonine dehydrogenase-like Zn-dependent dehydrogenase